MSILATPGDLAETPLAAVLLEALNLRSSGVLEVAHAGGTSRLWFRDGRPVGAQVFTGFKPLGMMLLQAGLIDIDALSRSLARMAETRRPQGEILVEMGVVGADDVGRVLAEQQASYFETIAALESGRFSFDRAVPVPEWTRGARLSPVRTIVQALERPQAKALVASALEPVAGAAVRVSSGYRELADAFRWTAAERALVDRLERGVPLDAYLAPSGVPPERARAILAGLLLLGVARAAGAGTEDETTGGIALTAEELTDSFPLRSAASPPVSAPTVVPPAIPAGVAIPTVAANSPTTPPAPRSDPAEARARRQRLLQQAMRNMGVGPFAGRGEAGSSAPSPPTPTPPAAPPPPAASVSGPERQLREALLAVAPRAKEQDLFVRLGLAENCGREDAKKAFLALARQFHPDRFSSPALADLQDLVKDFFASVNEAYEVLSDDRKRLAYLEKKRGGDAAKIEAASIEFQKGEACLRTRDFARARGFLESALRTDPRAQYQAALAWAHVCDPGVKDRSRAKTLVAEAMKDPSCDRAFFVAGIIARDEGEDGVAERNFREAIKLNPRNALAERELRLLEARRADKRR